MCIGLCLRHRRRAQTADGARDTAWPQAAAIRHREYAGLAGVLQYGDAKAGLASTERRGTSDCRRLRLLVHRNDPAGDQTGLSYRGRGPDRLLGCADCCELEEHTSEL